MHAVDENGKATACLIFIFALTTFDDASISCPENLWYRQGVTPSYPQGSSWEHISNNVRKVSVGPLDQARTMISIESCLFFTVRINRAFLHPDCNFYFSNVGVDHSRQSPGQPQSEPWDGLPPTWSPTTHT